MQLQKLKEKNLSIWVIKLSKILKDETNERNRSIYSKWLNEATAEQQARYDRRMKYLSGGSYGKENKKRRFY